MSALPSRAYPEFRRLATHPGDKAAKLRVIVQPLHRVVLPLQFLLGKRRVNGGVTDPVQRDGVAAISAARYEMVLIDAPARHEPAPAQRTIAEISHDGPGQSITGLGAQQGGTRPGSHAKPAPV